MSSCYRNYGLQLDRVRLDEAEAWEARAVALLEPNSASQAAAGAGPAAVAEVGEPEADAGASMNTDAAPGSDTDVVSTEALHRREPMSLEALEALVGDGTALCLRLERLGPVQSLLAAAQKWSRRAAHTLTTADAAAQSSFDEVCTSTCCICRPRIIPTAFVSSWHYRWITSPQLAALQG